MQQIRKYSTEFGLNVYTSYKTLIPVEHLDKVRDNARYHLYAILATPRVFYEKESLIIHEDGIECIIKRIINDEEITYKINKFPLLTNFDHNNAKYELKYPYDKLKVTVDRSVLRTYYKNNKEKIQLSEKDFLNNFNYPLDAQLIFNFFSRKSLTSIEMEVLYVGKAYGKDGARKAQKRLASHSKLQKILTDYYSDHQDKRIYILLMEMSPILNTIMDGISKDFSKNDQEDEQHLKKVFSNLPIYEQVINISEAAIINYFKPYYNENFVDNFPGDTHTSYRQYFDLDYNALSVEIDLEFDDSPTIELITKHNKIN